MSIGATNCLCPVDRGGQSETDLRARLRLGLLNQKLYAKRSPARVGVLVVNASPAMQ